MERKKREFEKWEGEEDESGHDFFWTE